MFLNPFRIT